MITKAPNVTEVLARRIQRLNRDYAVGKATVAGWAEAPAARSMKRRARVLSGAFTAAREREEGGVE